MGLYVHSVAEVPSGANRAYYIYLLDYGWKEPLGATVRDNLTRMADLASKSNAGVIYGPQGVHFEDEVLSWHHVNGQDAQDILPAILITTRHPSTFRDGKKRSKAEAKDALLLLPLRKICKTPDDVVQLIQRVFEDITNKKRLSEFDAVMRMKRGVAGALVDAVILQPNFGGIGFDLRKLFRGE
jgi:hypothetical protein